MKKPSDPNKKKGAIAEEIAQMKQRREERKLKEEKKINNVIYHRTADDAFEKMIEKRKEQYYQAEPSPYQTSKNSKIFVATRKRPLAKKEIAQNEIDVVSVVNPKTCIHECKIQVDGITKYLEDHEFFFDASFGENSTTRDVYNATVFPVIPLVLSSGVVTCFAYGQTGSGKTYTMKGIEAYAIDDLYSLNEENGYNFEFYISFYEIYGGRLFDLLNNRTPLKVLDDKNGKVQIYGLMENKAEDKSQMHSIIETAFNLRTTHNTVTNETSSRSHAICNICIKKNGSDDIYGKLTLVDLAGSERAQETLSNNRQRRAEGAEINKSLLALKECIRALEENKNTGIEGHVPFRASKLTHVLRDSFISKSDKSHIIMISCVSPTYSSANHSINTLRYSDRLKEKTKRNGVDVNANRGLNKPQNKPSEPAPPRQSALGNLLKQQKEKAKNEYVEENISDYEEDEVQMADFEFDAADDWEYLKRTAKKEGKNLDEDFVKYQKLTTKLIEEEDDIINTHLSVIKEDAQLIQKEGELIQKVKSETDNEDYKFDDYLEELEIIVKKKIEIYSSIVQKFEEYKNDIKEEDELRKRIDPKFFNDI